MTTETTLTDRQLDEYLWEHLFGWHRDTPPLEHWWVTASGARHSLIDMERYVTKLSSTGDGMLLVLESMRERGWDWWITKENGVAAMFFPAGSYHSGGPFYSAHSRGPHESMQSAHSLPRAVAEAARAALMAQA